MAKKKQGKRSQATQKAIDEFRDKFEALNRDRTKHTSQAIEKRRHDVWEMMCEDIPQTEMAKLLNVSRATIALDVKYLKVRAAKRVSRIKDDQLHTNVELGTTIKKLDSLTAAAFQEYATAKSGCLVGETRIWTNRGMVQIQDIRAGDLVMVHDDDGGAVAAPVVELIPKGKKPVYRLRTRHREIVATGNHPFLHSTKTGLKWVALERLTPSDRSVSPRVVGDKIYIATEPAFVATPPVLRELAPQFSDESFVRLTAAGKEELDSADIVWKRHGFRTRFLKHHGLKIQWSHIRSGKHGVRLRVMEDMFNRAGLVLDELHWELTDGHGATGCSDLTLPTRVTPDFCRLFGFWLADGWINRASRTATLVANPGKDRHLADVYLKLMRQFNPRAYIRPTDQGCWNIYSTSVALARVFDRLGWADGAHNKRIPDWVFGLSEDYREAFLLGFMDGDGHRYKPKPHHSTKVSVELCNYELVRDLKCLVDGLGYMSGRILSRTRADDHILKNGQFIKGGTSHSLNFTRKRLQRPFHAESVLSIEAQGEADVYDIAVGHKSHNFVADGLVVHNSEKAKFLDIATKTLSTKTRILQESGYLPKAGVEVRHRVEQLPTFADRFGDESALSALDNATSRHKLLSLAEKILRFSNVIDVPGTIKATPTSNDQTESTPQAAPLDVPDSDEAPEDE